MGRVAGVLLCQPAPTALAEADPLEVDAMAGTLPLDVADFLRPPHDYNHWAVDKPHNGSRRAEVYEGI